MPSVLASLADALACAALVAIFGHGARILAVTVPRVARVALRAHAALVSLAFGIVVYALARGKD